MTTQEQINFDRIAEAISFIKENFQNQPGLDEIAERMNMSSFHFQRMFTEWAGVSPKKFLQFISITHAKKMLKGRATLADASFETGLSGSSRLHDLFISIEGMTPAEYKHGGKNLAINYSFADSPFGNIIVASTPTGICHLAFYEDEKVAWQELKDQFPNATYQQKTDLIQQNALFIFTHDWSRLNVIKLHLRGTVFQLKVWESLIKIPLGELSTYGSIADSIKKPKASRAVGSAIGANPVAFIIPCHRVIQSTGNIGQYHWGSDRKTAMIGWEAAKTSLF